MHRPRKVLFSEHLYFVQICPVFTGPITYHPIRYFKLQLILMFIYICSINLLQCQLSTSLSTVVKAVQHVIKRVKSTGRRSVLAVPLIAVKTQNFNDVVEDATKENIIVVTSAGKI